MTDPGARADYDVHGILRIRTNVPLASLPEYFRSTTKGNPDLEVELTPRLLRPDGPGAHREVGYTAIEMGANRVYLEADVPWLTWLGSGSRWRVLLEGAASEITRLTAALPFGGFRPLRLRGLELLNSLVTLLATVRLLQRGYAPSHGSAVARNGRAALFLGYGGTGKTSVAHALLRRGWEYMADDYTVTDHAGTVYSYPLWNPPHPTRNPSAFTRYLSTRRALPPPGLAIRATARLGALVLLERGPDAVEELDREEALRRIVLLNAAELSRLWSNPLARVLDSYAYFWPELDFERLLVAYRACLRSLVAAAETVHVIRSSSSRFELIDPLLRESVPPE